MFLRELRDFQRLFCERTADPRTLVFYSERAIDYQYFEGYIDDVLAHSSHRLAYITSDPEDPLFGRGHPRMDTFYINHLFAATLARLDNKVLVMTMPDLGLFHIKRSPNNVNHVYAFHAVGSVHLQYNKGAFDHYDTVLCIGSRDLQEFRKWERMYGTKAKTLVPCGYPLIEKIYADHQRAKSNNRNKPRSPKVLVAPSWHDGNILEFCLDELIHELANSHFHVIFRPHPEYIKRKPKACERIGRRIAPVPNVQLELDLLAGTSIHDADLLVTDWSGICFEYAFGTERPVLFVNTPCKIRNADYADLGAEPIEFTSRETLGASIDREELVRVRQILRALLRRREVYRDRIVECRTSTLANWRNASRVGGQFLIDQCEIMGGMRERRIGVAA
jgi:YidC/Oxa1 family membrane protein insertase